MAPITLFRKPTRFEYILLAISIMVAVLGYYFISSLTTRYGIFSYEFVSSFMLWFISIILVVLVAVNENMKEELKIVIKDQREEIKLMREDLRRRR